MSEQTTTSTIGKTKMPTLTRGVIASLRRSFLAVCLVIGLVFVLLGMGLAAFTGYVLLVSEKKPVSADAIVVVTGGAGRLDRAVALLDEGLGKKLFISGVHPNYTNRTLLNQYKLTSEQINCCVELDSLALNTAANATQTALWAKKHGFDSLIIVTSAYHMPRTMLEMQRAAPQIRFEGHVVANHAKRTFIERLLDFNNMRLLTKEYGKLLASIFHGTTERLETSRRNDLAIDAETNKV